MVHIGVDLGGTNIKVAVVSENGEIIIRAERKTARERGELAVIADISAVIIEVTSETGKLSPDKYTLGMGIPGVVDDANGIVVFANNMGWADLPLADIIEAQTGLRPRLLNDADSACLAEVAHGAARGCKNAIILTLGTGIGSGIIANGQLLTGTGGAGELGHMVIDPKGALCTCGRHGCFETFASGTGLINLANKAIQKHPESLMKRLVDEKGKMSARIPFEAAKMRDKPAFDVVESYINSLALGITNIVNIFRPEFIGLSGGVSNEDDKWLLDPLREKVRKESYGDADISAIARCKLGATAGVIGAAEYGHQEDSRGVASRVGGDVHIAP
jgi:glucokinase